MSTYAICPQCQQKNRLPTAGNIDQARCGRCRASLAQQSNEQKTKRFTGWSIVLYLVALGFGVRHLFLEWWPLTNATRTASVSLAAPPPSLTPAYWSHLSRFDQLLKTPLADAPYSEEDFLWFVYESHDWLQARTYLDREGDIRAQRVFRRLLSDRAEFGEYLELFQLAASVADVTAELQSELRRLNLEIDTARRQQAFDNSFASGLEGGEIGAAAYSQGAGTRDAVLVGAAYTLISTVVRQYQDHQALDANKRLAIDRATNRSRRRLEEIAVQEIALRQKLQAKSSREMVGGELMGLVRRELEDALRPMDSHKKSTSTEETRRVRISVAESLLRLYARIPSGVLFDRWRAEAAYWSAFFLESVALEESEDKPWGSIPSRPAEVAVKVWELALRNDPEDPTGFIRAHRACSLALAGQIREARDSTAPWIERYARNAGFAALQVRLLSLAGDCDLNSLLWLENSLDRRRASTVFSWGSLTPATARSDLSLSHLRAREPKRFSELVQPRVDWHWVDGFLSDEVYLTNKSNFGLTNAKLSVTFHGGMQPFQQTFQVHYVRPGETVSWKSLKIPAERSSRDAARIVCEENDVLRE